MSRTGLSRDVVAQRLGELGDIGLVGTATRVRARAAGRRGSDLPCRCGSRPRRPTSARRASTSRSRAGRSDPCPSRRAGGHRRGPERCLARSRSCSPSCSARRGRAGRALGRRASGSRDRSSSSGTPVVATDHARLGRLSGGRALRRPLRGAGVGRQRREHPGPRRVALGYAVGHDNVIVVKIGTGIGAGIISNGRLHRGAQGAAGDVGHIQVSTTPTAICRWATSAASRRSPAGRRSLATASSAHARTAAHAFASALDQPGRVTAEDVARAASFGDAYATGLLRDAGERVGRMLASLVNFFNPSLVVIGGGVALSGDELLAVIREAVSDGRCPWQRASSSSAARRSARSPASSARPRWCSSSCSPGTPWRGALPGPQRKTRSRGR